MERTVANLGKARMRGKEHSQGLITAASIDAPQSFQFRGVLRARSSGIMRGQLFLLTVIATAAAQFTTSVQETGPVTITYASASTARPAIIPTTSIAVYTPPATTIDPWQCATKNISDYLKPPMPTGHLLDIYYDHSDAIYKECEDKLPKPFTTFPACPSVAKVSWCKVCHV